MFKFIGNNILGKDKEGDDEESSQPPPPFTFEEKHGGDSYQYPNLYEEADEMLQASLLIYSITDLRSLAKDPKRKDKLKTYEKILDMPLSLSTCLQVLEDNYDVMKECLGEADHINTMNSLNMIHARFQKHLSLTSSTPPSPLVGSVSGGHIMRFNLFASTTSTSSDDGSVEIEEVAPMLTYFGDENSDSDMVYAVGIDQHRKRITVVFRGSVTSTDFQKDAMISLNRQPNPVKDIDANQHEKIGIHHGFYDYLLKPRKNGMNKYQEIMGHVQALFLQYDRQQNYKLYCTGHSLGGALATLFSLYVAAAAGSVVDDTSKAASSIPTPVNCISVASPRVGDSSFQSAFCRLEERGLMRHLRIANDRDPVTMMPSATGKKVWATLSPISYLAFKLIDNKFEEKEKFYHTGVKLRLAKERFELAFMGESIVIDEQEKQQEQEQEEQSTITSTKLVVDDAPRSSGSSRSFRSILSKSTKLKSRDSSSTKSKNRDSFNQSQMPDVNFHLGNAYVENLGSVKSDLLDLSLNDIYKTKAFPIYLEKDPNKQ
ncbi:MAG: hypothetical protein ACI8RD_001589 [Bacillariaceae sp.]|jgi:hypothetical protein